MRVERTDMSNYTRMPFGQHRGRPLADLPFDYLQWLRTIDLRDPLRGAVQEEYARRKQSAQRPRGITADLDREMVDEVIGAGLRSLAPRYHPATGGSHAAMVRLNEAVGWLRSIARGLPA